MGQNEAQIRCACLVAAIEADKSIPFPQAPQAYGTLELLESRVRKLEDLAQINSPPPSLPLTWDALAWRICRLKRGNRVPPFKPPKRVLPRTFLGMINDPDEISVQLLKTTVSDIPRHWSGPEALCEFPKVADDEQIIDLARQFLYYMATQRNFTIDSIPITHAEIYALAGDLSLEVEAGPTRPGGVPPPPPPGFNTIWPPGAKKKKKPCCGCCSCDCHDSDDSSTTSTSKWSRLKRAFSFSWVKNLACWRRRTVDDDSSSTCSSTLTP